MFGYGDLVVDARNLPKLRRSNGLVVQDVTHRCVTSRGHQLVSLLTRRLRFAAFNCQVEHTPDLRRVAAIASSSRQ
jgi:3-deoxy-D-manno-octulosonic acid (KDO) 8-phosphate synthase